MDKTSHVLLIGAPLIWLGMVLAISFLEAPLKFKAPGITRELGLGIGRLVFAALNYCELFLAACVVLAIALDAPPTYTLVVAVAAVLTLLVQNFWLRPKLNRRARRIISGREVAKSKDHFVYIALELTKVALLLAVATSSLSRYVN